EAGRVSVLMDSDVVVNADPARVFTTEFDVGLTWRPEFPEAPFNGGVIFVGEGDGGRAFVAKALQCYEGLARHAPVMKSYPQGIKAWWGDQFAWAALAGFRAFAERKQEALSVDGIRVRFFPCAEYNFTIAANASPSELRR